MPALVVALAWTFKLDPVLAKGAIIITACPAATMGAMLSAEFNVETNKIAGQILASNIVAILRWRFGFSSLKSCFDLDT